MGNSDYARALSVKKKQNYGQILVDLWQRVTLMMAAEMVLGSLGYGGILLVPTL